MTAYTEEKILAKCTAFTLKTFMIHHEHQETIINSHPQISSIINQSKCRFGLQLVCFLKPSPSLGKHCLLRGTNGC